MGGSALLTFRFSGNPALLLLLMFCIIYYLFIIHVFESHKIISSFLFL